MSATSSSRPQARSTPTTARSTPFSRWSLSRKLTVSYSVLIAIVSGALSISLFTQLREAQRANFRERLEDIVTLAQPQIDPDFHSLIITPEDRDTPPYRITLETLQQIQAASDAIRRIYTVRQQPAGGLTYVFESDPAAGGQTLEIGQPFSQMTPFFAGEIANITEPTIEPDLVRLPNGEVVGLGYAPILEPTGRLEGVLVMELDASALVANERQAAIITGVVLLLILPVALGIGWWISRRLTYPIIELAEKAERIGQGQLDQSVVVRSQDEVGQLASTFNRMMDQLRQSFQDLESRVAQRTQELQIAHTHTQRESEALQQEVGHILDVVSAVEGGDLTVQAEVSSRVTGLVADTLNRLIEELSQVLLQVLQAAQQVSKGSDELEELARTVTVNADQQVQSVTQALTLTEEVEHLAQSSGQEVDAANRSLLNAQRAVEQGRQTIEQLSQGIAVLQQGTDGIVQRMKTLGEFVGLADQFVQEQGQIASLTQVLALNATLVAARASEQRDPSQFTVVAREFEAIAAQVSDLANQTNKGLAGLQQRTAQIHSVVSAIDGDVQSLSGLVSGFTTGVQQSGEIYSNIQSAAREVVQAGQSVARSNQQIVGSAQTTAEAMGQIARLAERTASLTRQTQHQVAQMDQLSAQLLERIGFFQLPFPPSVTHPSASPRVDLSLALHPTLETTAQAHRALHSQTSPSQS